MLAHVCQIGDFGTSTWIQQSTGLTQYTTEAGQTNHKFSLAWSAPEVELPGRKVNDVHTFVALVGMKCGRGLDTPPPPLTATCITDVPAPSAARREIDAPHLRCFHCTRPARPSQTLAADRRRRPSRCQVLEGERSTYASDVYSFGVLVWEVATTELPWVNKKRPRDVFVAVLRGDQLVFPDDAPAGIAQVARRCWSVEADERPTFRAIMEGLKSAGWSKQAW